MINAAKQPENGSFDPKLMLEMRFFPVLSLLNREVTLRLVRDRLRTPPLLFPHNPHTITMHKARSIPLFLRPLRALVV